MRYSRAMNAFEIAGIIVAPGKRARAEIEVARLYDFTKMTVPLEVIHGKEEGPVLFVTAAIHGDEINGVEIIKRLLNSPLFSKMKGTLIAVPIVNVFGFNAKQRYLPDRRDLNRCFPGAVDGSLAAQLAHAVMQEVVKRSTHGIDLHTGAIHRTNYPHVRAALDDPQILNMAQSFGAPLLIHSGLRDGSLREAARDVGVPVLLYEGGEALRFNESVIRMGVRGIFSVMQHIGMLPPSLRIRPAPASQLARSSYWVRAPHSGMMTTRLRIGDSVEPEQLLGTISDPFGRHRFEVKAKDAGVVIGMTQIPLLNEGDATFHIASYAHSTAASERQEEVMQHGQTDTYVM